MVKSYNFFAITSNGNDLIHVILNKNEGKNIVIVAFRKYIHVQDVDLNFTPKKIIYVILVWRFSTIIIVVNNCF